MSDGRTGTWLRGGQGVLAWVAAAYLALLPLGSFLVIPVGDIGATGSDLLLGLVLVMGGVTWFRSPGFRATTLRGLAGGWRAIRPIGSRRGADDVAASLLLLGAFSVWVASSAAWGSHPEHALATGVGYAALTGGAAVVVWSGIEWDRALSAWLLGTLLTVGVSLALVGVAAVAGGGGGPAWAERALYEGGSLGGSLPGLPGRRLRGPFLHPDGLGDYLVVSGALLWAGWPLGSGIRPGSRHGEAANGGATWKGKWSGKWTSRLLALLLVVALVLSLSSAWAAAGILLLLLGRRLSARAGATSMSLVGLLLRGAGAVVAATAFAALVFPLRLGGWGDGQIVTSGIRPRIWEVAFRAFRSSPVRGVGAAPALAEAVDPVDPGAGLQLWDAHNVYLSVMGQFGLVGILLVGGAAFFLIRGLVRSRGSASAGTIRRPGPGDRDASGVAGVPGWRLSVLRERARKGVLAALGAVGIHGLVIAGEDFRHWWALVAVAGLHYTMSPPEEPDERGGDAG